MEEATRGGFWFLQLQFVSYLSLANQVKMKSVCKYMRWKIQPKFIGALDLSDVPSLRKTQFQQICRLYSSAQPITDLHITSTRIDLFDVARVAHKSLQSIKLATLILDSNRRYNYRAKLGTFTDLFPRLNKLIVLRDFQDYEIIGPIITDIVRLWHCRIANILCPPLEINFDKCRFCGRMFLTHASFNTITMTDRSWMGELCPKCILF